MAVRASSIPVHCGSEGISFHRSIERAIGTRMPILEKLPERLTPHSRIDLCRVMMPR
jgi:hypothetical protein